MALQCEWFVDDATHPAKPVNSSRDLTGTDVHLDLTDLIYLEKLSQLFTMNFSFRPFAL